jgi:hypothetical protein
MPTGDSEEALRRWAQQAHTWVAGDIPDLPRLDVAAYEGAMRQHEEDPLSRTDTWVVKALQDPDDTSDDLEPRGTCVRWWSPLCSFVIPSPRQP